MMVTKEKRMRGVIGQVLEHQWQESWIWEELYTCNDGRPSGQVIWSTNVFLVVIAPASSTQPGFQHRVGAYATRIIFLCPPLLLHLKLLLSMFTQLQPHRALLCFTNPPGSFPPQNLYAHHAICLDTPRLPPTSFSHTWLFLITQICTQMSSLHRCPLDCLPLTSHPSSISSSCFTSFIFQLSRFTYVFLHVHITYFLYIFYLY